MKLDAQQQGVVKGMATAVVVSLVVLAGAVIGDPLSMTGAATAGERVAVALKADALLALWLAYCVGRVANHRFFTPSDMDGSGLTEGTARVKILQAVLQNSLEQTVLATLAHLAWALALPGAWLGAVPAAALLFLCGRVLFTLGYRGGAAARSLGFALTFYPSVLMLVTALGAMLLDFLR